MATIHLHQIFYSEQTRREIGAGFIPLDNSANARPDWREYWPIRNFLLNHELAEADYYAFLSPRFAVKTGLSAEAARQFIQKPGREPDVVMFSPLWDLSAFFWSVFEQADRFHAGLMGVARNFFHRIDARIDVEKVITDSRDTVFCNYLVAKPRFWREWLRLGEQLFVAAENEGDELAESLNAPTRHGPKEQVQAKVFLMERIASYIMSTQGGWFVRAYDPFQLMPSQSGLHQFRSEAITCDALKIAYRTVRLPEFRQRFEEIRTQIGLGGKPKE